MFLDDIELCLSMAAKHGPLLKPVVDIGGLTSPTIAAYDMTIRAMAELREREARGETITQQDVMLAQRARYRSIPRPLKALDEDYIIENPEEGGLPIEYLGNKYDGRMKHGGIGTAILLSVLEHVEDPFVAADKLNLAMELGGLAVVSVPFCFPYHPSPRDRWRFSPDGLRAVFERVGEDMEHYDRRWEILECDWRLRIPADAGVLDIHTGKPQAIESCYLVARAVKAAEEVDE